MYQQVQCAEGYTGPLCGSCARAADDGALYGRAWGLCMRCPSQAAAIGTFVALRLVDLAIIALQVGWCPTHHQAFRSNVLG